ncbi:MAG: hypothetical protein R3F55_19255 [Alphaproteobacteria bacterium]
MTKSLHIRAGLAAVLTTCAGVAGASESVWDHNGSEMLWEAYGDQRVVSYLAPRSGLSVEPGTILFEGRRVDDGVPGTPDVLEGYARTFRQGCPPAEYWVSGPILEETHVVLTGPAPVRAGSGCAITGYSNTSSNATLVFSYLRNLDSAGGEPARDDDWVVVRPGTDTDDMVGYRIVPIPLPGGGQVDVRVDTGVGSHVMPDIVSATLSCAPGQSQPLLPASGLNVCTMTDASVDMIGGNLVIDALRYNSDTGGCEPQRFEYNVAGLCN